jgi:hypothetical protein
VTAKPGSQKVYIYRGDPWEMTFSSTLDDTPEPVVALDALAQVRTDTEAADVVIEFTVAVSGDDDEIVTLSLTPEETATLEPGEYVWDFQPDPDAETWLKGAVTVEGDVSRGTS